MEWQPIETAPRQHTPMIVVIGKWENGYVTDPCCVWYRKTPDIDGNHWSRWTHIKPPTHWMPLPAPPVMP